MLLQADDISTCIVSWFCEPYFDLSEPALLCNRLSDVCTDAML